MPFIYIKPKNIMNKINVKCPNCGELFTTENLNESVCKKCNHTFSTDKGAKFYKSFINVERKKVVVAKGEAYLKVDKLLDEANFYLDKEDFLSAEEKAMEALSYTEIDFRIYMALVYAKTHNYQNLEDTSHIPYLQKAISLATEEQKANLKKEYKSFYQKQKMTKEEFNEYKTQEADYLFESLEQILKDGIPRHYEKARSSKINGILSIVISSLTLILLVLAVLFDSSVLFIICSGFAIFFIATFFSYITCKEKVNSFNLALDLFDSYKNFEINIDTNIKILKQYIDYGIGYLNNSSELSLSPILTSIFEALLSEDEEKVQEFISSHKHAKKYMN